MRDGRTLRGGVETGWVRARRTILAADAVSMIAAVVLYVVSVGAVRGFAFTLGLTTLIDVFVVFLFTKPLVTLLARTTFFSSGQPMVRARSGTSGAQGARCSPYVRGQGGLMSRFGELGGKLYRGEVSYDFVGNRKRWYAISAVILLLSIGALIGRQLTLGIEFEGGAVFIVPTAQGTVSEAEDAVVETGVTGEVIVTEHTGSSGRSLRIQTETLTNDESKAVAQSLAETFDVSIDEITAQIVGPSWGQEITQKALRGLVYFLVLVVIFLSVYFEWRMAVAALVALAHDLIITVGIYALVGFTVTPATIIGVLTILGYSLYDTVVVFDKVKENTRGLAGSSKMTYSESANLALNQTLVRSINTSIIALLPVTAILLVGVVLPRRRHAQGPGAGPVHRHRRRHVLLDLHRDAAAGPAQGARPADAGSRQARRGQAVGVRACRLGQGPGVRVEREDGHGRHPGAGPRRRPRRRRASGSRHAGTADRRAAATSRSARVPATGPEGRSVGDPPG